MSKKKIFLLTLVALVLSSSLVVLANPLAAYEIPWWTVDDGGGTSQGGTYVLSGTIGQADTGNAAGGSYVLSSGFWNVTQSLHKIYLTLVVR
jgi:membrane-associated PAP2 superfamily phosphatase